MSENVGVIADEHKLVLKHHQRPNIKEGIKGEHAEYWVDPISNKKSLGLVPITHESYVLLVDKSQLILLIEVHFFGLKIPVAVVEQLSHPLHLELAICLFNGQLDVLFIVFVDSQSFHLNIVDQIPQDLLIEGKEGEVRHDAEYSLSNAYL